MKTYGFDYAYAISWSKINEALKANKAGQGIDLGYNGTDPDSGTDIAITVSPKPYQIVAGGGNSLINLQIEIDEGSLELDGAVVNGSYDLSGVSLIVQVNLGWAESVDGAPNLNGSGSATQLVFSPSQTTDKTSPGYVSAVNVLDPDGQLTGNDGNPDTVAVGLLKQFSVQTLIANRKALSFVFADVAPKPASAGSWLVPAKWLYFNVANKSTDKQALCFLCMLSDTAFPANGAAFDADNLVAGYDTTVLISQNVLFEKAFLPSVKGSFPGGRFTISCSDEICSLKNSDSFTVGKVQTSDYTLEVDSAGTGLAISASGGGPLKFFFGLGKLPNASYSWSTSSNNPLAFSDGAISFIADAHPAINHHETMHWYDWALLVVTGITGAAGLASAIYQAIKGFGDASADMGVGNINTDLTKAFGGNVLNLAALIDWKLAGQSLSLSVAGLDGPLFARGNFS
ncbi:TULIP family P47-like protein [Paracoccus fistulariae]|uniref:TULIP family P47-like protein n=1 Tax=Paracoccus fistulariae TaxID=658446 RepID=A0ABY7SJX9_9RHOB|nr:TULIP family P47-like protein [Paracoccus fistulariae]MDB6183164.1 TULIP family P47-like protein [Paracoccus fistulariae]WCR07310.1 TULIP family P47-like protein [Paracoccus fistulariae]